MTSGSGRTINYDFENRPTSITKGGTTTSFIYDGDGGRVQKTDGTNTTVYIGKLYVCENGSCTKMIFAGSNRVAQKEVTGGATSYYHPDHLGSTSVITNSTGNSEQDLAYYPYGDTFLNIGTKDVKFKYTGKEKDDSTGLYFYEARYYDPFLGRFISADTIVPDPLDPQALNRYSYVRNNPIIYTDPTGNFFGKVFSFFGGGITGLTGIHQIENQFKGSILYAAATGGDVGQAAVRAAIFAATAAAAYYGGPIIGSLVNSGLSKAAGYDVDIGKNLGLAVLGAAASYGVGQLDLPYEANVVANGLVGGGIAELAGGSFADGFAYAAINSAVFHYEDIVDAIESGYDDILNTESGVEVAMAGISRANKACQAIPSCKKLLENGAKKFKKGVKQDANDLKNNKQRIKEQKKFSRGQSSDDNLRSLEVMQSKTKAHREKGFESNTIRNTNKAKQKARHNRNFE